MNKTLLKTNVKQQKNNKVKYTTEIYQSLIYLKRVCIKIHQDSYIFKLIPKKIEYY